MSTEPAMTPAVLEATPKKAMSKTVLKSVTSRRFVFGLLAMAAAAAVFFGLDRASMESFAGNSDGATVVLEGLALRHGHLLLSGWSLSFDSFWLVDAVVYAVVTLLWGFHHTLLFVVPALLATAVASLAVFSAAKGRPLRVAIFSALLALVLLGLPSPVFSFFLLQGPWHVGTSLWCLLAFVALSRGRFGLSWLFAIVMLAAALLGDLSSMLLGVFPAAFAAFALMARRRSLKAGLPTLSAAAAAPALAYGVRSAAVRIGTFSIAHGVTRAHSAQYPTNVRFVFHYGAALFGIGSIPIGPGPALGPYELVKRTSIESPFRYVALALVVVGLLVAIASIVYGITLGRSLLSFSSTRAHLNDFLLFGVGGSIALFIDLCPNGNGDYARYLTPAAIYAAVLAIAVVTQALFRCSNRYLVEVVLVISVLVAALGVASYRSDLNHADAPQTATVLGNFLESKDLTRGIGDYWSSSLVSVVTDNRVAVRPVIAGPDGKLARYGRQSAADWYGPRIRFTFLVFDLARSWRKVDLQTATATFGIPVETFRVGTYQILVWPKGFTIDTRGFTRG